ncbi:hypothetical protein BC332_08383 [Capsicum chinense]|nr:hypothetical protein BC332_08383 [Capsicum chinense]
MSFFLTLQSVQTLSDLKVVDGIKMELFGATTITRKIILEGGLIVVDDGSRSSAAVGANDAPLAIFEIISHYDYDHTDCKAKRDGVINVIYALTASVKEMTSKRGIILSKRISYPCTLLEIKASKRRRKDTSKASSSIEKNQKVRSDWSMIEAYRDKMGNPFDVQSIEGIAQQIIGRLNCGPFIAAYAEYLSNELQVPNNELDVGLLCKRYVALLWKYGEAKALKSYTSDIKNPRRSKPNSVALDEEQLVHID